MSTEVLDLRLASDLFTGIRNITRRDLQRLKLVTTHRGRPVPTVGGLLLLGKDRFVRFPDSYMKAARFEGLTRSRVLDMQDIRVPLPRMIDEAIAFVGKHTMRAAVFGGTRRVDRWTFPPEAVREAVVNAIIHADYSQIGGPIRLAIYDDRLEIENPGLLPAGLTIEDLQRGVSKPRNRVIARFFHEIKLAGQWGSGIPRMTEACLTAGHPVPEFEEIATHFRVILRAAESPSRKGQTRPHPAKQRSSARDTEILSFLAERTDMGGVSARELADYLRVTDGTVRSQMARLIAEGYAVAIGSGPNDPQRRYFATASAKPRDD